MRPSFGSLTNKQLNAHMVNRTMVAAAGEEKRDAEPPRRLPRKIFPPLLVARMGRPRAGADLLRSGIHPDESLPDTVGILKRAGDRKQPPGYGRFFAPGPSPRPA